MTLTFLADFKFRFNTRVKETVWKLEQQIKYSVSVICVSMEAEIQCCRTKQIGVCSLSAYSILLFSCSTSSPVTHLFLLRCPFFVFPYVTLTVFKLL